MVLALALLMVPVPSPGQQPGKVYRIGYLRPYQAPTDPPPHHCPRKGGPSWLAWLEGLREHGYILRQNLVIECRYTDGREERAPALAAELVSLKVDLLIAEGTVQVRAAKQVTTEIPIVMVGVIDPVGRGLVAGLAHPGGNVTGLTDTVGMEMEGKRLQLLKEAVPKLSRVAALYGGSPEPLLMREREAASRALGVTLQVYRVQAPEELEGAPFSPGICPPFGPNEWYIWSLPAEDNPLVPSWYPGITSRGLPSPYPQTQ
ncbi:MAG TPA: ABC transporter substrate-binding protein [Candidatus Methylomirabilis sp.]|nr:ABC transporter substrate-binding protein [Candidatus Methylomirabilis sp.]